MRIRDIVVSHLFSLQHCLICKRKFTGVLCKHCKENCIVRAEPVCKQCGIRLLSEIQLCISCREILCEQQKSKDTHMAIIPDCFIYSLWRYNEVLRKLIYEYKSNAFRALSYFFCAELYKYVYTCIFPHATANTIGIVPIPANPKKVVKRGFDQGKILAKTLATMTNNRCFPLFHRDKIAKEQKTLSAKARSENMLQALQLKNTANIQDLFTYPIIILLDDVVTTGATMQAAFRVLHEKYRELCISKQSSHSCMVPENPTIVGVSLVRVD